jgi:hypothetical protein
MGLVSGNTTSGGVLRIVRSFSITILMSNFSNINRFFFYFFLGIEKKKLKFALNIIFFFLFVCVSIQFPLIA